MDKKQNVFGVVTSAGCSICPAGYDTTFQRGFLSNISFHLCLFSDVRRQIQTRTISFSLALTLQHRDVSTRVCRCSYDVPQTSEHSKLSLLQPATQSENTTWAEAEGMCSRVFLSVACGAARFRYFLLSNLTVLVHCDGGLSMGP